MWSHRYSWPNLYTTNQLCPLLMYKNPMIRKQKHAHILFVYTLQSVIIDFIWWPKSCTLTIHFFILDKYFPFSVYRIFYWGIAPSAASSYVNTINSVCLYTLDARVLIYTAFPTVWTGNEWDGMCTLLPPLFINPGKIASIDFDNKSGSCFYSNS